MDTILAGAGCITHDEEQTQMAMWAISAAPMIMGNNPRNISDESLSILLNKDAIAVSQDPLGQMGIRLTNNTALQVWARRMANGDVAVALYNKAANLAPSPPIPPPPCDVWEHTLNGFYEPAPSNNIGQFDALSVAAAQDACCKNDACAGFSFVNSSKGTGSGFYKGQPLSSFYSAAGDDGYTKPSQIPKPGPPGPVPGADITLDFGMLFLHGSVSVYDIWGQKEAGVFKGSYTAKAVPHHGTSFLRLTPV
jgi:hypothetical protein